VTIQAFLKPEGQRLRLLVRVPMKAMRDVDFPKRGAGYVDLASRDEVYDLVRECIEKVNLDLSQDRELANSQIHRFLILHKELDADDGELTRSRKVRRGHIGEKYGTLVDALYGGKQVVHVEAQVRYEDGRIGSISADLKIRDTKTFPAAAARKAA